jgi:hypothetical protein
MRLRALLAAVATLALALAVAAPAMAGGAGEGLAGETNDKIVTFFCLGVVLFFTVVVIVGSLIQGRLEKRKDARKAAHALQRVGW